MRLTASEEMHKVINGLRDHMISHGFTEKTADTYWYAWKNFITHANENGYITFDKNWILAYAYGKCRDVNAIRKSQREYTIIRSAKVLIDYLEYGYIECHGDVAPSHPLRNTVKKLLNKLKTMNYSQASLWHYKGVCDRFIDFGVDKGFDTFSEDWLEGCLNEIENEKGVLKTSGAILSFARRVSTILCSFEKTDDIPRKVCKRETFPAEYDGLFKAMRKYCDEHSISLSLRHSFEVTARSFVRHLNQAGVITSALNVHDLRGYFLKIAVLSANSKKLTHYILRCILKSAYELGLTTTDLSLHCERIKVPNDARIPNTYTNPEIKSILDSADRDTAIGKRDYAILLIASQYGIRVGDIRDMTFDALHWDKSEIRLVQSKTGTEIWLPLSDNVGQAIIDYLRHGRPAQAKDKNVFVIHHAPYEAFTKRANLQPIMAKHLELSGIGVKDDQHNGMHNFRHSLASNMLAGGIPLPVVSEALGHSNIDSTKIYTKVDIAGLRRCAL